MKEYLSSDKLMLKDKQLLFNLRTRMFHVKCNYRRMYEGNLLCLLCDTKSEETQEHLLLCPSILSEVVVDKSVEYMDIFGPLKKQIMGRWESGPKAGAGRSLIVSGGPRC